MLNHLYKKTNHYRARYQEAEKFMAGVPEQLEIGCFGSSYARYDYDFDSYPIKGFNFGIFPQPLYYDKILLNHYIKHFSKNAFVLFNFPALVFALDTYKKDTANYKYYKFLNKDEIVNYSWKTKLLEIDYPLLRHPSLVGKIWRDDERIFNKIFWTTEHSLDEESKGEKTAQERASGWCGQFALKNLKDTNIPESLHQCFENNIKIVDEMLDLCLEHQLKPVLVIPPVAESLRKLFSEEFLQIFVYNNLERLDHKNVKILDYMKNGEFSNYNLYSNSDFMNKAGRLKFTGRVLGDLYGSCAVEIPKDKCTGCGACCQVCGRKAITMVTDQEGFWHPSIDFEKCNHCGRCAGVCPVKGLKPEERNEVRAVYAAWSLNEETRRESTSGGVFSELADEMLKNGAYVYGAAYNDDFMPEHRGIHSREEISKLRQSKYVQSDIRDCFSEIAELLRIGSRVFFCGTPCQCEALTRFLEVQKVQQDSLVLADFICRGVNSPKVYKIYLEELKKKYQSEISRVWFKNKTFGWNNFSTKVEFQNGDSFIQQRCDDEFMRGYLEQNLYLRPSCMNCDFKGSERCSDITLADFWGVNLEGRQKETDKGTSLIIIHSDKGQRLIDSIENKIFREEKGLQDILPGNPCIYESVAAGKHREEFMQDLDKKGFFCNIERFK